MDGFDPRAAAPNDGGVTGGERVAVTVNLSAKTFEQLERLAKRQGTTMPDIIGQGIGLQDYVARQVETGGKLLIEDAKGKFWRIRLP